jgi:hypothetical protein
MSQSTEPPAAQGANEPEAPVRAGDTRVRTTPEASPPESTAGGSNMLPARERRPLRVERLLMRLIATCGIVGIGVALGAILASSKVEGWITGLVVAIVSVVLSAILWSSRQL